MAAKLKNVEQGAATTVWCATAPQLNGVGGVYCENSAIASLDEGNVEHNYHEPSSLRGVKPYSLDAASAQKLWALSEALKGISFTVN